MEWKWVKISDSDRIVEVERVHSWNIPDYYTEFQN